MMNRNSIISDGHSSDSKVINLDKPKLPDNRHSVYWMPEWSMRMLIIGGSGRGKTNAILNSILRGWLDFDTLIVCANDIEEEKYNTLREWCEAEAEDRDDQIEQYELKNKHVKEINRPPAPQPFRYLFIDNIAAIPDIHQWDSLEEKLKKVKDPNQIARVKQELEQSQPKGSDENNSPLLLRDHEHRRTLILIDDMINEKYQGPVSVLFTQGRKKNISSFYIAHSYFAVPEMMRKNTDQFMLFGGLNKTNVKNIADGIATGLERQEFYDIYCATTKPYDDDSNPFMFIDLMKKNPDAKIRRNFDTCI